MLVVRLYVMINKKLYTKLASGIIIPTGSITSKDEFYKSSFLDLKRKGGDIKALFANSNVILTPNSGLQKLINDAAKLSDDWFLSLDSKVDFKLLLNALYLDRIADSILLLSSLDIEERKTHLEKLKRGSIELLKREKSISKDKLWELELWRILKTKIDSVFLDEKPDIVIKLNGSKIGIACKKLYSEGHVQNVISKAVNQIEKDFKFGAIAINLDDLIIGESILRINHHIEARNVLQKFNTDFITRHDRHLRKYLESQRIIAFIVSTSIPIENRIEEPKFSYAFEWTAWSLPNISKDKIEKVNQLHDIIMN